MDDQGRLHMSGFVGRTFEETGVSEEMVKEEAKLAEMRNAAKDGMNRKSRRAAAKLGLRELERRRG